MNETISYEVKKEKMYPGYKLKVSTAIREELKKLCESKNNWLARYEREKEKGAVEEETHDGLAESCNKYDSYKEAIHSGSAFVNYSVDNLPYFKNDIGYSLGNNNQRVYIDSNRVRVPMDYYNNTSCAEIVEEGAESTTSLLTDYLTMIDTDTEEAIFFDDILRVGCGVYADDKDNIDNALVHNHEVRFINAENKKAFEIIRESKEALPLSVDNLINTINENLCGKAKKKAVIIVNKSGFAKLDIQDDKGQELVKKNINNEFVFRDKYIIQEVDNDILPNTDNGETPCIIGDMSIVKFFISRDDSLVKDDMGSYSISDRNVKKEVITLSTKSNEAYIHGLLA